MTGDREQIRKIEHEVYISIKDYIEAIMREQQRAIEQATAEREKAAQVLRESLIHQIKSGDEGLVRHIHEQIRQLRQMIENQTILLQQAQTNSKEAITKAETAIEKRFDGVNEFRQTLSDQATKFLPRDEYNARHESIEKEIQTLADERVGMAEKQIARLYGGLAVVAFVGIANLVKVWFIH